MATRKVAANEPPETEQVDVPTAVPDREHEVSLAENPEPNAETGDPTLAEAGLSVIDGVTLVVEEVWVRISVEVVVV